MAFCPNAASRTFNVQDETGVPEKISFKETECEIRIRPGRILKLLHFVFDVAAYFICIWKGPLFSDTNTRIDQARECKRDATATISNRIIDLALGWCR